MSSTEKDDKNENESIPKLLWAINVTANNYQIRWISTAIRAVRVKQHIDISRIAFATEDMQLFRFVLVWFCFVWFWVCVFVCEYRSDVCTCQFNWNSILNESFNSIGCGFFSISHKPIYDWWLTRSITDLAYENDCSDNLTRLAVKMNERDEFARHTVRPGTRHVMPHCKLFIIQVQVAKACD